MHQHSDTAREAAAVQLDLLRSKTPLQRWSLALRLSDQVIRASKRAIARAHPEWTPGQINEYYIELHYGRDLADAVRRYVRVGDDSHRQ